MTPEAGSSSASALGSGSAEALVGHSGFVGSNLAHSHEFSDQFNSSTIGGIAGREFELVVFAAARAEKWRINQDPDADRVHIDELKGILGSFDTRQLVLISTVDVYKHPVGVDENTPVPEEGLHPYGAHRYELEQFAREQFDNVLVVRLPGLFGPGIKKNVIFDLLHDNGVSKIDHRGTFQYYNLERLWSDLKTAIDAQLELVNFATEPISTGRIAAECFGLDFTNEPVGSVPGRYDMRSVHAAAFGGDNGYLYSADRVLADLKSFVEAEKGAS